MPYKDEEKRRQYYKLWWANNKDRMNARYREYRKTHREQIRQNEKRYSEKHEREHPGEQAKKQRQ